MGFSAAIPRPMLFDVNLFQSGLYSLTVNMPGCDVATATAEMEASAAAQKCQR
ncbi:MAG: hypothetical protein R2788_07000 [Saprospiraceae bacterium]